MVTILEMFDLTSQGHVEVQRGFQISEPMFVSAVCRRIQLERFVFYTYTLENSEFTTASSLPLFIVCVALLAIVVCLFPPVSTWLDTILLPNVVVSTAL